MLPPCTAASGRGETSEPSAFARVAATSASAVTGRAPSVRCEPLGLAAQREPEAMPVVENAERGQVGLAAPERLQRDLERHVTGDCRELARKVGRLAVLEQLARELRGASNRQRADAVEAGIDLVERGKYR